MAMRCCMTAPFGRLGGAGRLGRCSALPVWPAGYRRRVATVRTPRRARPRARGSTGAPTRLDLVDRRRLHAKDKRLASARTRKKSLACHPPAARRSYVGEAVARRGPTAISGVMGSSSLAHRPRTTAVCQAPLGETHGMTDRIADPGARGRRTRAGAPWPERVDVACSSDGLAEHDVERWVPIRVGPALQRRRDRHRGQGRADRRRARPAPTTASTTAGSIRRTSTAGRPTTSPDRLTRPLVRDGGRLVETRLGHGDGAGSSTRSQALLERARRLGPDRLLHHRPAVPRGVLHARGDRQGRASARRTWTATRGCARRPRRRR